MSNTINLGNFISEYSVRNRAGDDIPVYSVTNKEGFCRDYFSKDVASQDRSTYKIVPRGCFAYNPSRINVGSVDWQRKEDKVIVSPLYVVFSVSKGLDQQYLYYYLKSEKCLYYIKELASGSVRDNLKLSMLKEFTIPNITLEEQRKAVMVLEQTDRLIALQERQMTVLDELVKSRFVEMFGDRDSFAAFPLESNVEEMFIGPFGSSLKNECFVPETEGYCMVYEQKHAIRKTMNVETRYVTEEKYKELKRFNVQGGDIIVSCRGTIGETYIVPENAPLVIMHPSIMKIRLKSSAYNNVFFDFLLQDTLQKHNTDANGSGVKMAVTANTLGKEVFIQPAMHLQNRFAAFVAEVDKSKLAVKQSLEKLETLKKSLMQQYFG